MNRARALGRRAPRVDQIRRCAPFFGESRIAPIGRAAPIPPAAAAGPGGRDMLDRLRNMPTGNDFRRIPPSRWLAGTPFAGQNADTSRVHRGHQREQDAYDLGRLLALRGTPWPLLHQPSRMRVLWPTVAAERVSRKRAPVGRDAQWRRPIPLPLRLRSRDHGAGSTVRRAEHRHRGPRGGPGVELAKPLSAGGVTSGAAAATTCGEYPSWHTAARSQQRTCRTGDRRPEPAWPPSGCRQPR